MQKEVKVLKKLQEKRKSENYNLLQMSKLLGISKTYYWQIENSQRRLTYDMAKKIAILLKTKPDVLFYDEF